jgi:hypothetical protein
MTVRASTWKFPVNDTEKLFSFEDFRSLNSLLDDPFAC